MGHDYVFNPPHTLIVWPVIYADLSDARNTASSATSEAWPNLFKGTFDRKVLRILSSSSCVISDSINPGAMTLLRMLRDPISLATDLLNPMMPAFDAAYFALPALPKTPTTELI